MECLELWTDFLVSLPLFQPHAFFASEKAEALLDHRPQRDRMPRLHSAKRQHPIPPLLRSHIRHYPRLRLPALTLPPSQLGHDPPRPHSPPPFPSPSHAKPRARNPVLAFPSLPASLMYLHILHVPRLPFAALPYPTLPYICPCMYMCIA